MEDKDYQGLPMAVLRTIIHQLTTALSPLSSLGIVHADLKPDNVMFVEGCLQPLKVNLIDFGLTHLLFAAKPGVCVQDTRSNAAHSF